MRNNLAWLYRSRLAIADSPGGVITWAMLLKLMIARRR